MLYEVITHTRAVRGRLSQKRWDRDPDTGAHRRRDHGGYDPKRLPGRRQGRRGFHHHLPHRRHDEKAGVITSYSIHYTKLYDIVLKTGQ